MNCYCGWLLELRILYLIKLSFINKAKIKAIFRCVRIKNRFFFIIKMLKDVSKTGKARGMVVFLKAKIMTKPDHYVWKFDFHLRDE